MRRHAVLEAPEHAYVASLLNVCMKASIMNIRPYRFWSLMVILGCALTLGGMGCKKSEPEASGDDTYVDTRETDQKAVKELQAFEDAMEEEEWVEAVEALVRMYKRGNSLTLEQRSEYSRARVEITKELAGNTDKKAMQAKGMLQQMTMAGMAL